MAFPGCSQVSDEAEDCPAALKLIFLYIANVPQFVRQHQSQWDDNVCCFVRGTETKVWDLGEPYTEEKTLEQDEKGCLREMMGRDERK